MATIGAKTQDMPPEGGYNPINFKRVPAKVHFKGSTIIGGYFALTGTGLFFFALNYMKVKRDEIEMRSGSLAIQPLLQAERDREYLKQLRKNRDEEADLMKNVPGWVVGTWYGEPLYKNSPKDTFHEPALMESYYIHTKFSEFKKRALLSHWV